MVHMNHSSVCSSDCTEVLRQQTVDQCQCPVPCSFLVFDPVVSYADVSPLLAERLLADTNLTTLTHHFSHAREVTHRLQREKRQLFEGHVLDLTEKLGRLQICLQVCYNNNNNNDEKNCNDDKKVLIFKLTGKLGCLPICLQVC